MHKGQGRAMLEGRTMTVVPGMSVVAPPRTWHGLRNTGTGDLHIAWLASPPGVEVFFRELSRLSGSADAAAIQAIAQRYGVEFHPDEEGAHATVPASRHRHRRHRDRGNRPAQPRVVPAIGQLSSQALPASANLPPVQDSAPPVSSSGLVPASTPSATTRGRHRRSRGRSRSGSKARPPAQGTIQPLPHPAPPTAPHRELKEKNAAAPQGDLRPSRQPPRRGRFHHRGRIKEVYMGGRWVQVSGEGPVISPGHERSAQPPKSPRRDEDTPRGPLSVPL